MNVTIGPYPEDDNPRQIDIRIDPFDTWSMDHTLAIIILPMLKQLHVTKHGAPFVEDEDVPEHLRSTAAPAKENDYDIDDNHFKRWDYVLDEMIWAMEQIVDCDGDDQFYYHSEVDEEADIMAQIDKIKYDYEGLEAHNKRKQQGCVLFGKYLTGLWD